MAITLDSMVRNATAGQKAGVSPSSKADLATGAFDIASKSVGSQVDATSVQLSPFGQVKSSFVDVQSAGTTLTTPAKTSTVEDATKAVQSFADAYNNASKAVDSAIRSGVQSLGALAGNAYAASAGVDLKKIVTGGSNMADMQKIGIRVNQDGTLSVDAQALQNAIQANPATVQDTLARVGAQAVQMSQKELATTGNIGSGNPGIRTDEAQKPVAGSRNAVQQQGVSANGKAAGGVAAYTQMIGL